jgi:predicted  nucleic acid-binding Zn-ribbon protein
MATVPKVRLTPSNRDVTDILREELEDLVAGLRSELRRRQQDGTILGSRLTRASSKLIAAECSLRDKSLHFLSPPGALHPKSARSFCQVDAAPDDEDFSEDSEHPRPPGEQRGRLKKHADFDTQPAGAYNPFQGATRRVVYLRQKIGELQQQNVDVHAETVELARKRDRLRAQIEQRGPPTEQRFRHERLIPVFKPKKSISTLKSAAHYCDEMLKREKEPELHDELLCVYCLLAGDELASFELLQAIWAPHIRADDLAKLEDLLEDRSIHVSILSAQFRRLVASHKPLCASYRDLKQRINHVVDHSDQVQGLEARIKELEDQIAKIPAVEKGIAELTEQRNKLLADKEEIVRQGSLAAAKIDAAGKSELAEIRADKAATEREQQQLEHIGKRLEERYATISEDFGRLNAKRTELVTMWEQLETETSKTNRQWMMLENVGLENPDDVLEVWKLCADTLPTDLVREAEARKDQVAAFQRELDAIDKQIRDLEQRETWMSDEIQRCRDRIKAAEQNADGTKSDS